MAEEQAAERTEEPTRKRLLEAHEQGQVARTPELSGAFVLLAGAAALAWFAAGPIATGASNVFRQSMGTLRSDPMTPGDATAFLRDVASSSAMAVAPFLGAVLLTAVAVNAAQARGVLSLKPIAPDLSRINPGAGFKRLLSGQSLFTLIKSILKLIILGVVMWISLRDAWPRIVTLSGAEPLLILQMMRTLVVRLVLMAGGGFLALSLFDYGIAVWRHQKKLRMSRQEVIQEFKESEGDPMRKVKMRSVAAALVRRRMLHRVKEADVIIVNPTSIAVAIKYDGITLAPVVVAMGRRKLAERILAIARQSNVPVVRNIPVARALIATAKVGMPIPPALYAAVAEVLAFVYRQRGSLPRALADVRMA